MSPLLKKPLVILFAFVLVNNLQAQVSTQTNHTQKTTSSYKKQTIRYKLTEAKDHTYGYNIFLNDTLFVHQPVIPCIAGNKGFKTKADAKKVAFLVIDKIRKGLIPPTVTIPEMEKLKIDLR